MPRSSCSATSESGVDEAAIYAFDSTLHVVQPFTTDLDELKGRLVERHAVGRDLPARRDRGGGRIDGLERQPATCARRADRRHRHQQPDGTGGGGAHRQRDRRPGLRRRDRLADRSAGCGGPARDARGRAARRAPCPTSPAGRADSSSRTRRLRNRASSAHRIVEELRHQYLIGFEPSGAQGWHPLELKVRRKDHTVQARSGYVAGQSRPVSD